MCKPAAIFALWCAVCLASEQRGEVSFGGLPVPGATVIASQDQRRVETITDQSGSFDLGNLSDGAWTIEVSMTGFATLRRAVLVTHDGSAAKWELTMLPASAIQAAPVKTPAVLKPEASEVEEAADGLLINGSMNNGAASPFAQAMAFGNRRAGSHGLYNGGIGLILDNSALDAKPFSLTGQELPKTAYNRLTGVATLGGPLRIPHLLTNGGNFFVGYQWTRNNNATTDTGLMPDLAERTSVPLRLISPQALALLRLYPLPNFSANSRYNYQIPVTNPVHMDALQSRWNKQINSKNQINAKFAFESTRSDTTNLFDFQDGVNSLGVNAGVDWFHRLSQHLFCDLGYQFSRLAAHDSTNFENKENISALAGIGGNNQQPMNWGPPTLSFASGIAGLTDGQASFNRNQTSGISASMIWNRGTHNLKYGADFRRQEFNYLAQQNPRGVFTFTGSDFADFLLGIPDASSIAYGNADKYLRQSVYDAYLIDDWRISPGLTLNAGLRWDYGAPVTELYGRLENLEVSPGFSAIVPVQNSLLRPDKRGFQPRIGLAWRAPASSLVIRAGYGIYDDTSVYQSVALQMAQQPPLSKNLSLQNSAADPLTLANGFTTSAPTPNTFGADPNFRVGYAQNWSFTIQRDLPWAMQMSATYLGIKGTRGRQEFLPNSYPIGAVNPCPSCPLGFVYLTSNGNSSRESGQVQLRRRLHNGFTATLQYTLSKSIDDDAASGTSLIAQDWENLSAERGRSSFDQRQVLNLQLQYTTGMGMRGGTLLTGWKGALLKEWTFMSQVTAGSGLAETPVYLATVPGTGFTGTIRPDYTGTEFVAPASGEWGNAGRGTITGPDQFSLNASMGRVFRLSDKFNLEARADSTNALNHVNFSAWNTTINNAQFGLPTGANAMRSVQLTMRLRF